MAAKKTLYEILGVARDATSIDVGLAYEKRMQALQRASPPDPSAQSLLHEAFEVLSNPQRREAYDASLITQSERAAAQEQAAAPDLVLEAEEPEGGSRKLPWVPILGAVGIVVIGAAIALGSRKPDAPAPAPAAQAPEAPAAPAPPPPPKPRTSAEVLAAALPSVGRVLAYEMSGTARPLGLALAVEPGAMVTTCEGVRANATIVVRIGAESHSATLTITDEVLGLCKLSVPGVQLKPLPLAPEDPKPGQFVRVVGANAKGEYALTDGKVVKTHATPDGAVLELSVPIAENGGGGAVFDEFGRVCAVATHRLGKGVPAALPASSLAALRSRTRAK